MSRQPNIFSASPIEQAFAKGTSLRQLRRASRASGLSNSRSVAENFNVVESIDNQDNEDDNSGWSDSDQEYQPEEEAEEDEDEGDDEEQTQPRDVQQPQPAGSNVEQTQPTDVQQTESDLQQLQRDNQKRKRAPQTVATKSIRQIVVQWMIEECSKSGKKGVCAAAIDKFPEHFRGKRPTMLERARSWMNDQDNILEDLANMKTTNSITSCQTGKRVRLQLKCRPGRGRKPSQWVSWLHEQLLEEFMRLRGAGVKFSPGVLAILARDVLSTSEHPDYQADYIDPKDQKPIMQKVTSRWIQHFMERHDIVHRCQTGKLQCSPEKEAHVQKSVAFHMGQLCRGFQSGELKEDLLENADETHFVINMDNGRQLAFRGDDHIKYADVVQGGEAMTMIVRLTGGPLSMIETPMLIFKNKLRSYPMQGVPDTVDGVYYRTGPKGWNDKVVFPQYINDTHFRRDQHGRTKILFMDNCSGHNESSELQAALVNKNTIIRFFPPCSTHLVQPADSFVISKIKEAWRNRWDEYKVQMMKEGKWSNDIRRNGSWSGKLLNPGRHFFLKLAAYAVREVNKQRDAAGLTYACKAMIRCGLALDVTGRWHVGQLTPELQEIISKYKNHFEGEVVPLVIRE